MRHELVDTLVVSRIRDSGPALTRDDLRQLEVEFNVVLPEDYCEFLLIRNGGCYYDQNFIEFPQSEEESIKYFYFHALNSPLDLPCDDLRAVNKAFQGRLPPGGLAIGSTGEDRLILCGPPNEGLYTLRQNVEVIGPTKNHGLEYVAASFAAFARACREVSLEEREHYGIEDSQPFMAIEVREYDILEDCLRDGFYLQDVNGRDQTALYVACLSLNYEAARLLLERGADPNDGDRYTGRPPIYAAAAADAGELCSLLLSHGASRVVSVDDGTSILDTLRHVPSEYVRSVFDR